jgi:hypothetical protein
MKTHLKERKGKKRKAIVHLFIDNPIELPCGLHCLIVFHLFLRRVDLLGLLCGIYV